VEAQEKLDEPSLRTNLVLLQTNTLFRLTMPDGSQKTGVFHSLICESIDQSDKSAFLDSIEAFLSQNKNLLSAIQNIVPFFRSLIRLFAISPAKDLENERKGLWGELFLMREIKGYKFWVPFWHSEVTRTFDFTEREKKLEIKTSSGGERIHHFSHNQIFTLNQDKILIVSILVENDEIGLSLRQLINDCKAEIFDTPYYLKLEKSIRYSGMNNSSESGPKYNLNSAKQKISWFQSIDVPHFCLPEPPGVSNTTYRVDLSRAPKLGVDGINNWLDSWSQ